MKTSSQTSQQFIKIFLTLCLLITLFANHVTLASAEQNMQTPTDPGVTDLVSWWTLDETSDTRTDSHADNDLSSNNSVSYSSGKQNNSAEFNGTNQSLQVSDNSSISMGDTDFTIGGWVNIDTLTHLRALMGKGPSNGANVGYEYILEYDPGPNKFWFSVGNGTTYGSITDFTPSTSTWYFLIAWHDSANDMLYLQVNNGTPASASYSGGSYDSSHSLFIGKAGAYNGGYMDGLIDEAFIYKRVLTEGERTWLYNSGDGRTYSDLSQPPPPTPTDPGTTNLIAWWTFNEASGTREDSHSNNDLEENHQTVYSASGKQDDAALYTGNNNNLGVLDNSNISMGDIDFTIGGWVNMDTLGSFRGLMGKGPTTGVTADYEYLLGYDSGPGEFWFSVGNDTTYGSVTDYTPSTSTWYFLVAWHDSLNDMIYLQVNNGVTASASYSGGSWDSSSNLLIGRPGEYFGGFMDGLIDEAFIYKRVLTAGERSWLYNSGNGRTYSDLAQPPTPTPTATFTPTNTPTVTPTFTPVPTSTLPNSYTYNRSAAVAYANTWVHSRNSDFGNVLPFGTNYAGCNCDNCTNFMSQVLLAGGYPLHGNSPYDWLEYWWYTSNSSSSSWRHVPSFKNYYESHPDEFSVVNQVSMLEGGDIIMLDLYGASPGSPPDGVYDHIKVVVGHGNTSTNPTDYITCINGTPVTPTSVPNSISTILINQNCIDRKHVAWDYGVDENASIIFIHVIE